MEHMEPLSGNRVERRRKIHSTGHVSKPYERESRTSRRKNSTEAEEEQQQEGLFGGLKSFLKKFTYTPTKQQNDHHLVASPRIRELNIEDERSEDERNNNHVVNNAMASETTSQSLYPQIVVKSQPVASRSQSEGDIIARAIETRQTEITMVEYEYYLKLLQDRLSAADKEKALLREHMKSQTTAFPPDILRPAAHHAPGSTPADVVRTFLHGRHPAETTSSTLVESPSNIKRRRSPPVSPVNGYEPNNNTHVKSTTPKDDLVYLDRLPPPAKKRSTNYSNFVGSSEAARRIMETLDQMATPIEDAKASRLSSSSILGNKSITSEKVTTELQPRKIEKTRLPPKPVAKPLVSSIDDEIPPTNQLALPTTKTKSSDVVKAPKEFKEDHVSKRRLSHQDEDEEEQLEDKKPSKSKSSKKMSRKEKKQKKNRSDGGYTQKAAAPPVVEEEQVIDLDDDENEQQIEANHAELSKVPAFSIASTPNFFSKIPDLPNTDDDELEDEIEDVVDDDVTETPTTSTPFVSNGFSFGLAKASEPAKKEEPKVDKKEEKKESQFFFGNFKSDNKTEEKKEEKKEEKETTSVFGATFAPTPFAPFSFTKTEVPKELSFTPLPSVKESSSEEPEENRKKKKRDVEVEDKPEPKPAFTLETSNMFKFTPVSEEKKKEEPKVETAAPALGFSFASATTAPLKFDFNTPAVDAEKKPEEKKVEEKKDFTFPTSSFGLAASTALTASPSVGFSFGAIPTLKEDKKDEPKVEKPAEVPKEKPADKPFVFGEISATPSKGKGKRSTVSQDLDAPTMFGNFTASTSTTAAPAFTFGSTQSSTPTASFTFGSTTQPTTPAPAFTFNADTKASMEPEKPSTGFTFGAPSTGFSFGAPTPVAAASSSAASNDFVFGGTSTPTAAPAASTGMTFGSTSTPATTFGSFPAPTFGTSNTGFSTESTPFSTASTGFAFGSTTTPATTFGSSTVTSTPTTFSFGSSTFGATSTPAPAPAPTAFGSTSFGSTTGFNFNATPTTTSAPFGSTTPAPFGSTAPAPFGTDATFSFGQTPTTSFSFGTQAPTTNGFTAPSFGTNSESAPSDNSLFSIGANEDKKDRKFVKGKRRGK